VYFLNMHGVTPNWECTVVRRTSPFILIAVAQRRVPPRMPGRDSNQDLTEGALTNEPVPHPMYDYKYEYTCRFGAHASRNFAGNLFRVII
jgi:hypothetical protein